MDEWKLLLFFFGSGESIEIELPQIIGDISVGLMMQFATTSYETVSKFTANQFQVEDVYNSTISDRGIPSSEGNQQSQSQGHWLMTPQ